MSRENVEIWRANIEGQLAGLAAGARPEARISKLAEVWDAEIDLDATDGGVLDLNEVYRGAEALEAAGLSE